MTRKPKAQAGDEPQYVGVPMPDIFDLDEYIESIGYKPSGIYYVKDNKKILLDNGYFCCLSVENDAELAVQIETVELQMSFLPDIWLINFLLYQIGFTDKLIKLKKK